MRDMINDKLINIKSPLKRGWDFMNILMPTLLAFSAFCLTGCGKNLDKDLVGNWSLETILPISEKDSVGQMTLKCTDSYFPNKTINSECDFKVAGTYKEDGEEVKLEMEGAAKASGEWSVTEKTVYEKTVDAKVNVSRLVMNGEVVTDKEALEEFSKEMQGLFLKGETNASKTISFDGNTWVFEQEIDKKKITVTARRM